MRQQAIRWLFSTQKWYYLALEFTLVVFLVLAFIVAPASAAMRLQERSLYMNTTEAAATTFYRISFRYMSPDPVGSVEMLFCQDPIPYHPCDVPTGLDVSNAQLSQQAGEVGFSISNRSENRIVISRTATAPSDPKSAYTFDNIVNPVDPQQAFAIRLKTHSSTDASGPQVDFGSVRGQITEAIEIATQVPPMLIFCLAEQVSYNCTDTNEVHYSDMGQLDPGSTLTAQSQMAVGTNASSGFVIIANGAPLSAGTNVIESPDLPSPSLPGQNQFGINLVENTQPAIGANPEGEWANAVVEADYASPDFYKFQDGDVVASSPNVSLMKKFTVSYVLNSSPSLRAGVYTTTVNFIASGRF